MLKHYVIFFNNNYIRGELTCNSLNTDVMQLLDASVNFV